MPKEARKYLHGKKQTRKEAHTHPRRSLPSDLAVSSSRRREGDSSSLYCCCMHQNRHPFHLYYTRPPNDNSTRVHGDQSIRRLPAHHSHDVSSTAILQTTMEASIFTAQHNKPSHIPVSRCISSTYPRLLCTCTHAHVHLQASSPASTCPPSSAARAEQATANSPTTHPLAHNRRR
jgi:hypothetical protein